MTFENRGSGEADELESATVEGSESGGESEALGEDREASGESATTAERLAIEAVTKQDFDSLQERYLRLAAEYDNFRKRTDRERIEQRDRAQGQVVQQLLEVLDDLQRIAGLDPRETEAETALEGVRLVERKFFRALEAAGLEPVPAEGERFDPEQHEALMVTETTEPDEDDTVGNVFQAGYRFRGSLLRPARVQVKKLET